MVGLSPRSAHPLVVCLSYVYIMDMITANVATLKQKLSHYLRLVEAGDQVVVTSHRRPVARLVPETGEEPVVRPPSRPVQDLLSLPIVASEQGVRDVVEVLVEDRRRR
jgi:prevent-host-death family protein